MSDLISRPYEPHPDKCCEACVFGGSKHADWCTTAEANRAFALHCLTALRYPRSLTKPS